jgi:hypothetical protein
METDLVRDGAVKRSHNDGFGIPLPGAEQTSLGRRLVSALTLNGFTGQDVPVTGQHFLTYQWSETSVADGTFWIHRIPMPILLVRDQSDGIVQPFEPYQLLAAAHGEGSLAPSIDYVLLPDAKPISLKVWLADRQL